MKPKGLVFGVLCVLVVTASSAAVASAQSSVQNTAPSPVMNNTGNFDPTDPPGTKQASMFVPGQTDITGTKQTLNPQPNRSRQKGGQNKNDATPTEAAPSPGNYSNPGGSDPSNNTSPGGSGPGGSGSGERKELPKTGGTRSGSLVGVGAGALLVGGGLLVRRFIH